MSGFLDRDDVFAAKRAHEKAVDDKIKATGGFGQQGESMIGRGLHDFAQANGQRGDGPLTSGPTIASAVVWLAQNTTRVRELLAHLRCVVDNLEGPRPGPKDGYGIDGDEECGQGAVAQLHALNGVLEQLISECQIAAGRISNALGDRVD